MSFWPWGRNNARLNSSRQVVMLIWVSYWFEHLVHCHKRQKLTLPNRHCIQPNWKWECSCIQIHSRFHHASHDSFPFGKRQLRVFFLLCFPIWNAISDIWMFWLQQVFHVSLHYTIHWLRILNSGSIWISLFCTAFLKMHCCCNEISANVADAIHLATQRPNLLMKFV